MDDNQKNEKSDDGGETNFKPQVPSPVERYSGPPLQRPGMIPSPMRPPHDGGMGMRPPHRRFPPPVINFFFLLIISISIIVAKRVASLNFISYILSFFSQKNIHIMQVSFTVKMIERHLQ